MAAAGTRGAACCRQLLERTWIVRMPRSGSLRPTAAGRCGLAGAFGLHDLPGPLYD
jgi:hypothetical protein